MNQEGPDGGPTKAITQQALIQKAKGRHERRQEHIKPALERQARNALARKGFAGMGCPLERREHVSVLD